MAQVFERGEPPSSNCKYVAFMSVQIGFVRRAYTFLFIWNAYVIPNYSAVNDHEVCCVVWVQLVRRKNSTFLFFALNSHVTLNLLAVDNSSEVCCVVWSLCLVQNRIHSFAPSICYLSPLASLLISSVIYHPQSLSFLLFVSAPPFFIVPFFGRWE